MQSKLLKLSLVSSAVLFSLLCAGTAGAVVTVAAPAPYIMNTLSGGEFSVYYPQTAIGSPFYIAPEFQSAQNNMAVATTTLSFYVSGFDTTKHLLVMVTNTSGTSIPIVLDACDGVTCTGGSGGKYHTMANGAITVRLRVDAICDLGTATTGCLAGKVFENGTSGAVLIPGVKLNFVESASTSTATTTEITDGIKVTAFPEVAGPDLVSCPTAPGFFPGDTSILVETNSFQARADTSYGSSPNFTKLWVKAHLGTLPADYSTASISQVVDLNSGQAEILGFTNSTTDTQTFYQADYGVQDTAGVILFCGNDSSTNGTPYPIPNVFATDIQGFLRESNCFVATASYRDGRAPGVMLLRKFRDEVLSKYKPGRGFIGWYYTYGPIAADWLIEHPVFRSFFLMLLIPLQVFAWITLHPGILFLPFLGFFLGLFLIAFLLRRERGEHV